jgi:hypothetical protein
MAEVLVEFSEPVASKDGGIYGARACGRPTAGGTWEGWIEFLPADGGKPIRSARETTQPNRQDTVYWATGLTPVYLEGSLDRALNPLTKAPPAPPEVPVFDEPAPAISTAAPVSESVLNPFSVYRKGEDLLRRQLGALSGWHLVNIIRAYDLSDQSEAALSATPDDVLLELIVAQVRAQNER